MLIRKEGRHGEGEFACAGFGEGDKRGQDCMDKLVEIMAWKRQEVGHRVRPIRDSEYERLARLKRTGKGFGASLRRAGGVAVIAEIKRRSPSAGAIAPEVEASEQARLY